MMPLPLPRLGRHKGGAAGGGGGGRTREAHAPSGDANASRVNTTHSGVHAGLDDGCGIRRGGPCRLARHRALQRQ